MTGERATATSDGAGERVLNAIERITEGPEEILARVEGFRRETARDADAVARRVIAHYSDRSALVGAATALPALVPGIGTAAVLLAGPLADMVLLLKLEVEMCLALSSLQGNDIRRLEERQLVLLLAALHTTADGGDRSVVVDGAEVVASSIWSYGPRRVGKLLVTTLGMIAALQFGRRALLALPVVGIVVGAGMNKALTTRVGRRAHEDLRLRARLASASPA